MEYKEYIKPELLVLIPVLYYIGMCFKQSKKVDDRFIPMLLGCFGVLIAMLYMVGKDGLSFLSVFSGITQGILCAGTAVYVNQLIKQSKKG